MITMDDQYRFEDFGFDCEPGNEDPATPNYESKTLFIPGRVGMWDFGTEIKDRPFSFPLKIIDRFYTNMQRSLNDFVAFLLDPYGKPRIIKIEFDYDPGKHYFVKINGPIVPKRVDGEWIYNLNFIANDPLKYSNTENYEVHWDSTTVTFDDAYSINTMFVEDVLITSPQTVETTITGFALTPNILISGSGTNVKLEANGKSLTLGTFSNSNFEIKGSDFTILKDGQEVFINGDFLSLLPGLNQINISGTNVNFNLSIRVRDQYI
jgi:phage-related protein